VVPGFDNTPRRAQGRAMIFRNADPRDYEYWLRQVLQREKDSGSDPSLVFVNAWNEWAEGNHLEPCERFGHGYLAATGKATKAPGPEKP